MHPGDSRPGLMPHLHDKCFGASFLGLLDGDEAHAPRQHTGAAQAEQDGKCRQFLQQVGGGRQHAFQHYDSKTELEQR